MMEAYLTFAGGVLAASILWFVFFTVVLVTFVLKLYDGIEERVDAVKARIETIRWVLQHPNPPQGEVDRTIDDALASVDLLFGEDAV